MREIKFRALDPKEGWYYFTLKEVMTGKKNFTDEDWTVVEFTGLKDKNGEGNEVFGGDLFECVYSNIPDGYSSNVKKEVKTFIGEVVFHFGSFMLKVFNPDHNKKVYMELSSFLKNPEKIVIGNIHENPELL